jgi:hypothetical protein
MQETRTQHELVEQPSDVIDHRPRQLLDLPREPANAQLPFSSMFGRVLVVAVIAGPNASLISFAGERRMRDAAVRAVLRRPDPTRRLMGPLLPERTASRLRPVGASLRHGAFNGRRYPVDPNNFPPTPLGQPQYYIYP